MKLLRNSILCFIFLPIMLTSCNEFITHNYPPVPVYVNYFGVMEVRETGDNFTKTQIVNTSLEAGDYKIVSFPKALELKSYYVKVDAQGNIGIEYKLNKKIDVEPKFDGTIFGILQITNKSQSIILQVPVGYLP